MITLSTSGNSVIFTFQDNQHYLQNGTIEVPKNSLSLVTDDSNMATFKKSASNDIFLSALYSELGMSKSELEAWFEENAVGSMGVDPEDVLDIVDENTNYIDGVDYVSSANTINFYHGEEIVDSIDTSDFVIDGMIDDVRIETISGASYLVIDFNTASGKEDIKIPLTDIFDPSNYYTKAEVDAALSGKADTSAVTADIAAAVSGKVDSSSLATVATSGDYDDLLNKPTIPTVPTSNTAFTNDAGYITEDAISGKADTSAVTAVNDVLTAHTADTTIHVTSSDKSTWSGKQDALVSGTNIKTINNQSLLGSGNITISGGSGSGTAAVEVTQAEYDALVSGGTVDPTVFYIITDAPAIEASGFVQTSAITSAVTSASTDSEIPTAKAVFDAIPTGGTGASYSAGTNISIDSANTISCTLPLVTLSSRNSLAQDNNSVTDKGFSNVLFGVSNSVNSKGGSALVSYNTLFGKNNKVGNSSYGDASVNGNVVGGENNTISGSNYSSHNAVFGNYNTTYGGSNNALFGSNNNCYGSSSAIFGKYNNNFCYSEFASGQYNNSVSASTTFGSSGNTLFSVGNGTADNARHNAFEIRQNGDIYITSGGTDIKLQDNLGGGSVTTTSAVTSGSTDVITSGGVYAQLDGLKLQKVTQAEYDALVSGGTVDNNTLYVVVN